MIAGATYTFTYFEWGKYMFKRCKMGLFIYKIFQSINFDISRPPNLVAKKVTNFGVWTNLTYQGHQIW